MYESVAWNLIVLVIGVVAALLVLREAVLWYWKVNRMVKLLEEHSQQNRYILDSLQSLEKRSDTIISLLRAQNERFKAQGALAPASVADKPESSQEG